MRIKTVILEDIAGMDDILFRDGSRQRPSGVEGWLKLSVSSTATGEPWLA